MHMRKHQMFRHLHHTKITTCKVNTDAYVLRRAAGAQNFTHNVGEVNYWGSSKTEDPGSKGSEAPSFKHAQAQQLDGTRVKDDIGDNGGRCCGVFVQNRRTHDWHHTHSAL